jgi:hypothetical protein
MRLDSLKDGGKGEYKLHLLVTGTRQGNAPKGEPQMPSEHRPDMISMQIMQVTVVEAILLVGRYLNTDNGLSYNTPRRDSACGVAHFAIPNATYDEVNILALPEVRP